MVRIADGLDVEGPVRAELFVVWLHGDRLELTGPCGAAPWLIEIGEEQHPIEAVTRMVQDASASCSWCTPRHGGGTRGPWS